MSSKRRKSKVRKAKGRKKEKKTENVEFPSHWGEPPAK